MGARNNLLDKLLAKRNVSQDELYHTRESLPSPFEMKDMDRATEIIADAIVKQRSILIVADFDCDGATSCATLLRGLVMLGLSRENVDFIVPNRFIHGYGLTPLLVDSIVSEPGLIITVDNGISSHAGIAAVRDRFPLCQVVVTDHHLQGDSLPEADAIINPNRKDCAFPSKAIAGVGVAFYLLLGLKQKMAHPAPINNLLDIVALGTICDVVPLDRLNRTLVHHGINRIRNGKAVAGIDALLKATGKDHKRVTTTDFGFILGPRINAAGRLSTMIMGINLLLEDNLDAAMVTALTLDATNVERKKIEKDMQDQAQALISGIPLDKTPNIIILYDERWHQGVIGLVASRIKESAYRPAIIFAKGDEGDIKASCRSIPGINIRDVLATVFMRHPELGNRFGGHAFAAGLTIKEDHFELFKSAMEKEINAFNKSVFTPEIETDGEIESEFMTLETARMLLREIPWGKDFEPPIFEGKLNVSEIRTVGAEGQHLRLRVDLPNGKQVTAMGFNQTAPDTLKLNTLAKMIFTLDVNEWNERESLQLLVRKI